MMSKDILLEFGNSNLTVDYIKGYYKKWWNKNDYSLIKLESDIIIVQLKKCPCPDTMFHVRYFFKNFNYDLVVNNTIYKAINPNLYFKKMTLGINYNFLSLHLSRCKKIYDSAKHHVNCTGDFPLEKIDSELELLIENLKSCHKKIVATYNPFPYFSVLGVLKEEFIFNNYQLNTNRDIERK